MDGEDVSEWFVDGADVGIWNIFLMSIMGLAGVDVAAAAPTGGLVEDDEEAAGGTTDALDDMEALPLTWPEGPFWPAGVAAAGTDPKDFTPSDLRAGAAAGDEDIGADTSSIDPKVTAEPAKRISAARDEVTADD